MASLTQAAMWHRQAAALAAAADRVGVAETELPAIHHRLLSQRARFAELAVGSAATLPDLVPTPMEIAAAMPALGDLSATAVAAALASVTTTLDATDVALANPGQPSSGPGTPSTPPQPTLRVPAAPQPPPAVTAQAAVVYPPISAPPTSAWPASALPVAPVRPAGSGGVSTWPPHRRNALVYGAYALTVTVLQGLLFVIVDTEQLPLYAPCCLFVMPAFAWAAGWFTVGLAFRSQGGPKVNRTPRTGALICLIPDALLFVWLIGLLVLHVF